VSRKDAFDTGTDDHEYWGSHQPNIEGPGAHEVDQIYPDYYERPALYHSFFPRGSSADREFPENNRYHRETRQALMKVRGKPDALMRMYRAAPHGVEHINTGDWVTPSEQYARVHAYQTEHSADDWPVLHADVPAHHLRAAGDYIPEFGYSGPSVKARVTRS
jgi:hypothetical protein